jgi:hypothetical protein
MVYCVVVKIKGGDKMKIRITGNVGSFLECLGGMTDGYCFEVGEVVTINDETLEVEGELFGEYSHGHASVELFLESLGSVYGYEVIPEETILQRIMETEFDIVEGDRFTMTYSAFNPYVFEKGNIVNCDGEIVNYTISKLINGLAKVVKIVEDLSDPEEVKSIEKAKWIIKNKGRYYIQAIRYLIYNDEKVAVRCKTNERYVELRGLYDADTTDSYSGKICVEVSGADKGWCADKSYYEEDDYIVIGYKAWKQAIAYVEAIG